MSHDHRWVVFGNMRQCQDCFDREFIADSPSLRYIEEQEDDGAELDSQIILRRGGQRAT